MRFYTPIPLSLSWGDLTGGPSSANGLTGMTDDTVITEGNSMMTITPWGKPDAQYKIDNGVYWVGTPGHGGFMIGRRVAADGLLSQAAIDCGEVFGDWLAYEEDCACYVVFFEH